MRGWFGYGKAFMEYEVFDQRCEHSTKVFVINDL